jgi:hypothetical protein
MLMMVTWVRGAVMMVEVVAHGVLPGKSNVARLAAYATSRASMHSGNAGDTFFVVQQMTFNRRWQCLCEQSIPSHCLARFCCTLLQLNLYRDV